MWFGTARLPALLVESRPAICSSSSYIPNARTDAGAARAARAAGINQDASVPIGLAGRHRRAEAWVHAALILCMLMFVCFVCAHTREN